MERFVPLNLWMKKRRIKKSGVTSFVDGLELDVKELSDILGCDVVLAVRDRLGGRIRSVNKNSKLKIRHKSD